MSRFIAGLLVIASLVAQSAEVKLSGISALPGYPVRILAFDDLISGWQATLASAQSDFKGSFELKFNITRPGWVTIAAAQYKTELFVAPGGIYRIQLILNKESGGAFFDPQPLTATVLESMDGGLSEAVAAANVAYNAFVLEHFNALYRSKQENLIDSLRLVLKRLQPANGNQFFNDYAFYKIASLEQATLKLRPQQVFERYFKNRAVLESQPEYVSLLRETFKDYLINHRFWTTQEYAAAVEKGLKAFETLILRDQLVAASAEFRELLVLMHFAENYSHPLHARANLPSLLETLANSTSKAVYAQIARNIVRKSNWLSQGSNAPVFALRDENGKLYEVNRQSPALLLVFVSPECRFCEFELLQMRELKQKWGNLYQFLTISLPESHQFYVNFHKRNKLDWPILSLGNNYALLDALDLRVFPHMAIYLPGSKIGLVPAPPTDRHLEGHLRRLAGSFSKP